MISELVKIQIMNGLPSSPELARAESYCLFMSDHQPEACRKTMGKTRDQKRLKTPSSSNMSRTTWTTFTEHILLCGGDVYVYLPYLSFLETPKTLLDDFGGHYFF